MRVFVTGATGFLGQHLVRELRAHGHTVRALGRNPDRCRELTQLGVEVVQADLRQGEIVRDACADQQIVYHVGALSAPWGPSADFHAINVEGTRHVLDGCRKHGVSRLIHVSSPSVIFDGSDQFDITDLPYPRQYLCEYSLSKKLAEDLVNAAHRDGLATVILRPKAMFGPGDTTLLPRLIDAARRKRLPQIGDGTNRIDLTYVANVVDAMLQATTSDAAIGRTYTITNDEHVPIWDLIRQVLKRLGIPASLPRLPYRVVYTLGMLSEWRCRVFGGEPRLTRYTVAILARNQTYDISAARRDLGYNPRISIAEGVERTLESLHG